MKPDPLTLTLNHPLKNRVEKLSARPTGAIGRIAALSLILSGTALAAPLTASTSNVDAFATVTVPLSKAKATEFEALHAAYRAGEATSGDIIAFTAANPQKLNLFVNKDGALTRVEDNLGRVVPVLNSIELQQLADKCRAKESSAPLFLSEEIKAGVAELECHSSSDANAVSEHDAAFAIAQTRITAIMELEAPSQGYDYRVAKAHGVVLRHLLSERKALSNQKRDEFYTLCMSQSDALTAIIRNNTLESYDTGLAQKVCTEAV